MWTELFRFIFYPVIFSSMRARMILFYSLRLYYRHLLVLNQMLAFWMGGASVISRPHTVKALMSDVNDYLLSMFYHYGINECTGRILRMLSCGVSTKDVASYLSISARTDSVYKINGLRLLNMKINSYNLYRVIFVKTILQQY